MEGKKNESLHLIHVMVWYGMVFEDDFDELNMNKIKSNQITNRHSRIKKKNNNK